MLVQGLEHGIAVWGEGRGIMQLPEAESWATQQEIFNWFLILFSLSELPDLVIDTDELQRDMELQFLRLPSLQCALEENCLSISEDEVSRYLKLFLFYLKWTVAVKIIWIKDKKDERFCAKTEYGKKSPITFSGITVYIKIWHLRPRLNASIV